MDKIFLVIPVVNLWDEYTIHCMESIAASICELPFEVVIVDNGSTDETVNKATDFGNRKLPGRMHVLHNDTNRGCAGGWNQGLAFALEHGATHVIIANNDILVGPFAIQGLYNRMKKGGVLLCSAVDVMKEVMVPQEILDPVHPVNHKDDTEAPHPNFSFFMVTPETVETVGWFDEEFFPAYFEDNDYHYRLKCAAGDNAAIANTTAVFAHYGSRTQNQVAGGPIVPGDRFKQNETYFAQKWGGTPRYEKFIRPFNSPDKDLKYAKRTQ